MSFTIHVSVTSDPPLEDDASAAAKSSTSKTANVANPPTVLTQLAIGCRKKLVIYSWKNGEPQAVKASSGAEVL